MNTPVNFEIAKLLKEKGFDNESAHYYNEKGELLFDVDFPSLQPTKPDVYYNNPTIAEVVMWLYEKHRIWISVLQHTKSGKGIYFESVINVMTFSGYNSPTEAYEAAIEYTLKNLLP
jgi:hypothetical protein